MIVSVTSDIQTFRRFAPIEISFKILAIFCQRKEGRKKHIFLLRTLLVEERILNERIKNTFKRKMLKPGM